ncbi:MAG: hypothetical protein K2W96_06920 [Gemmataceae bacterium]|nr:hypothetical protein [Gemmataceae bacterium]
MRAITSLALAAWLALAGGAVACPFCSQMGKSLVDEVKQAQVVVFGQVEKSDEEKETSEILVKSVLKDDPSKAVGKTLKINKYLDKAIVSHILLFCEEYKGGYDAYRGLVLDKDSSLPQYVKGALARADKPVAERLKFHFDYLDDKDGEVATDAYKEFANASYDDFKAMAKDLPADRVLKWLKDKKTPSYRFGLYGSMIGHCGKPEHAKAVEAILDDPDKRTSGMDGLLAALVMLKPKEGFARIEGILKNPKEEFMHRFAALRSLRFLHEYRQDLIDKKRLAAAAALLLPQDDINDMAIEDLRKWKAWETAPQVLAQVGTKAYDEVTVIRRSILRYCLQAEGVPEAAAHVAKRRKEDAEAVKDAEELLQLEAEAAKPKAKK